MKWPLMFLLMFSLAVLGCNQTPKETVETVTEDAQDVSFDDAMSSFDGSAWLTDYDKALAYGKELNRPVLINFTGSDWCGWCIKLVDEVFSKESFAKYAKENLVLLKLDFPRKIAQTPEVKAANEKLAREYQVEGFPTILLISPEGKVVARTGYQPGGADAYVAHLKGFLAADK
ncbi:MAG: thioredoxin family protein [Candidatus Cloacimonetes bacterium]|nr:thioredoxin family protein [Candidatus Cloacimonadota bacterium]